MGRRPVAALTRLLLLPLVVGACATTTTVETRSGNVYEAHTVGGSPGSVYLANKSLGRFSVRREDVADVDFPGNVQILGGLALSAFGGWRLVSGDTQCSGFGDIGNCMVNVVPSIAGLLIALWGTYVYVRARSAFEDRAKPEPDQVMKPRPAGGPFPGWRKPDPFADPRP
ncbi:MAG TPA: hypothetical protein VIF57_00620 [Polyangia bacterium]